jgi:hypothetical protein
MIDSAIRAQISSYYDIPFSIGDTIIQSIEGVVTNYFSGDLALTFDGHITYVSYNGGPTKGLMITSSNNSWAYGYFPLPSITYVESAIYLTLSFQALINLVDSQHHYKITIINDGAILTTIEGTYSITCAPGSIKVVSFRINPDAVTTFPNANTVALELTTTDWYEKVIFIKGCIAIKDLFA